MASKPELISRVNWDTVACKSEGLAVDRHAASLPRHQMASPRWRPKFQSTTTPGVIVPATCWPSFYSSAGRHGTN
jgi:hypothetical protein